MTKWDYSPKYQKPKYTQTNPREAYLPRQNAFWDGTQVLQVALSREACFDNKRPRAVYEEPTVRGSVLC